MKVISIYEAKTQLSKLVDMALAGQEIVISRRKKPLVFLKPVRVSKARRKIGTLPGLVLSMPENFNDSLDDGTEDPLFSNESGGKAKQNRRTRK